MSEHLAPGPMAGYLFQIERAIHWLVNSGRDAIVAIESYDDVAVIENKNISLESDKHSITKNSPLSDRSVSFWKTIYIWLESIDKKEIELENTRFYLTTNKIVKSELINIVGKSEKDTIDLNLIITSLEKITENPSDSIKKYTKFYKKFKNDILIEFFKKIELIDGNSDPSINNFILKISESLHIPKTYNENDIINQLKGWILTVCQTSWRNNEASIITREAFDHYYYKIISDIQRKKFRERTKSMIPRTDEDIEHNRDSSFIRQILLFCEEDKQEEYILDAIDDFICCRIEWARLAKEGEISQEDFKNFEDRLIERWKILRKKIILRNKKIPNVSQELVGEEIYLESLDHREELSGQETEQYYLTRGTYQTLSDKVLVGWHPDYKKLLGFDNE